MKNEIRPSKWKITFTKKPWEVISVGDCFSFTKVLKWKLLAVFDSDESVEMWIWDHY